MTVDCIEWVDMAAEVMTLSSFTEHCNSGTSQSPIWHGPLPGKLTTFSSASTNDTVNSDNKIKGVKGVESQRRDARNI